jgi:hypothetical protein
MKTISILLFFAECSTICLLSCTTLRRYSSEGPPLSDNSLAGVDLFGFTLSEARPEVSEKTLWDLSADAQAQFIKILNTRYPENKSFIEAMNFRYLNDLKLAASGDFVNKDLRMIFSVSRKHDYNNMLSQAGVRLSPADRIEYLKIILSIPENSGIRFRDWNMYSTEYGSIDIGDVSFSRSLETEGSATFFSEGKNSGSEIAGTTKSAVSRREEQEIRYRYLKLNGRISNNRIEMEEEGTRETDLAGNILADISMSFERFPLVLTRILNLRDSTGTLCEPYALEPEQIIVAVPSKQKATDTIFADLSMDYVYRNVTSGDKTYPEWDDRICYCTGHTEKKIILFTPQDYMPDFFCIGTGNDEAGSGIIKIADTNEKEIALIFRTYEEADSFYEWLQDFCSVPGNMNKTIKAGKFTLRYMNDDLTCKMFKENGIFRTLPYYTW